VDAIGRETAYEYDGHLLVKEQQADGTEIFWQYDDNERCIETWRTGGVFHRLLEFDDRRKRVLVTTSRGFSYLFQKDDHDGITSVTDR